MSHLYNLMASPGFSIPAITEQALIEIGELEGVEDIAVFADVHLKEKYLHAPYKASIPSSISITTDRQHLYPQFRSRGVGCGMMLIRTGLTLDKVSDSLDLLVKGLANVFNGAQRNISGASSSLADQLELHDRDMAPMSLYGAPWLMDRAGEKCELLDGFHNGGGYMDPATADKISWKGISEKWKNGKARSARLIGRDLVGNHFLELQVVDSEPVDDRFKCLQKGELVLMYHGSCNGLGRILDPGLIRKLIERPSYEFLAPDDEFYRVLVNATKLLMNWSAAARALVLLRVRRLIAEILPWHTGSVECLSEGPHNGIFVDDSNDATPIIYRHNTAVLDQAIPTIVSGRNDHASYLVLPGEEAQRTLHSIDHGIGAFLKQQLAHPDYSASQTSRTLRLKSFYRARWSKATEAIRLLDSSTVEREVLESYVRDRLILEGYARLVPLWTFKNERYTSRTVVQDLLSTIRRKR